MGLYSGYKRIMEKNMEATILHRGYIGIMEKEHGNYYVLYCSYQVGNSVYGAHIKSV